MSQMNRKQQILRKALPLAIITALTLTIGVFSVKKIIKYFSRSNGKEDDKNNASPTSSPSKTSSSSETSSGSSWGTFSEIDRKEYRETLPDLDDF